MNQQTDRKSIDAINVDSCRNEQITNSKEIYIYYIVTIVNCPFLYTCKLYIVSMQLVRVATHNVNIQTFK